MNKSNISDILFFIFSILLVLLGIYCIQLLVYIAIHFEGSVLRAVSLYREVGMVRFLVITGLFYLKNVLSVSYLHIWLLYILIALTQWLFVKIHGMFTVLVSIVLVWLLLLRVNVLHPVTIMNDLSYFVAIANWLILLGGVGLYVYILIRKRVMQDTADTKLHTFLMQRKILLYRLIRYRLGIIVWGILLLSVLTYQYNFFYVSLHLIIFSLIHVAFIVIALIREPSYKHPHLQHLYSTRAIVLMAWRYISGRPIVITLPAFYLIFHTPRWPVWSIAPIVVIVVAILIVLFFVVRTSHHRLEAPTLVEGVLTFIVWVLVSSVAGFSSVLPFIYPLVLCIYYVTMYVMRLWK